MIVISWFGSFIAILASVLISLGTIKKEHWFFSTAMLVASVIFMVSSLMIENIQSVISNGLFILSSLLAVLGVTLNFKFISFKNMMFISLFTFVSAVANYIVNDVSAWFFQSIGWIPVVTLPFTFMLFTQHKISEKMFFMSNLLTHIVFFAHLMYVGNYPIATLQIVCGVIALLGVSRNIITPQSKAY